LRLTFNALRGEPVLEVFVETVEDDQSDTLPVKEEPMPTITNFLGRDPFSSNPNTMLFGSLGTEPTSRLAKFQLRFQSMIGDSLIEEPVTLSEENEDLWKLHFHLVEVMENEFALRREYTDLRSQLHRRMGTGDDDNYEVAAKKLSTLVRKLRKLSQSTLG
jgi:hypothetical protein